MTEDANSLAIEEFRALRATIRERGSLRFLVALVTFSAWAAALIFVAAYVVVPLYLLVPLAVLLAGFEIVFAIHVGVERIGRYLQHRYESVAAGSSTPGPAWEHTAMGLTVSSGGAHSLFLPIFLVAAVLNWLLGLIVIGGTAAPEETRGLGLEVLVFGAVHVAVIARWLGAARFARTQRARDLAALSQGVRPGSDPEVPEEGQTGV